MISTAKTSPLVLAELKNNHTMTRLVVNFLIFANTDAPHETVRAALGDLDAILENTEGLLRHAFNFEDSLGASRLPRRLEKPLMPKEALEALQISLDIMQIEVEALLRKPWATDEEYKSIARRRDHVIQMMGYFARYYKAVIVSRDPGTWTPEVEKRFEKFLKIKP